MAHAGNGGLQRHSIGDTYPWCAVGTVNPNNGRTVWYVQNLVTGHKRLRRDGNHFETTQAAHEVCRIMKARYG